MWGAGSGEWGGGELVGMIVSRTDGLGWAIGLGHCGGRRVTRLGHGGDRARSGRLDGGRLGRADAGFHRHGGSGEATLATAVALAALHGGGQALGLRRDLGRVLKGMRQRQVREVGHERGQHLDGGSARHQLGVFGMQLHHAGLAGDQVELDRRGAREKGGRHLTREAAGGDGDRKRLGGGDHGVAAVEQARGHVHFAARGDHSG